MNVTERDILWFCAFRYCLGRNTYIVSKFVDIAIDNLDEIPKTTQWLLKKEIKETLEKDKAGMDCDRKDWQRLLDKLND